MEGVSGAEQDRYFWNRSDTAECVGLCSHRWESGWTPVSPGRCVCALVCACVHRVRACISYYACAYAYACVALQPAPRARPIYVLRLCFKV
jgi:hypothetical protein